LRSSRFQAVLDRNANFTGEQNVLDEDP